ncbi:MAG: hypothetical protein EZS28_023002 [Streblomastix strix]|uniref:Uncharacterized protein n=1 Tax=Streblomastix strix TaxID=222440 RepID=A0A5J4VFT5_9EUKA|nr:MAG: hypothetical protein EZS28_023002 [Streblomastix strix]
MITSTTVGAVFIKPNEISPSIEHPSEQKQDSINVGQTTIQLLEYDSQQKQKQYKELQPTQPVQQRYQPKKTTITEWEEDGGKKIIREEVSEEEQGNGQIKRLIKRQIRSKNDGSVKTQESPAVFQSQIEPKTELQQNQFQQQQSRPNQMVIVKTNQEEIFDVPKVQPDIVSEVESIYEEFIEEVVDGANLTLPSSASQMQKYPTNQLSSSQFKQLISNRSNNSQQSNTQKQREQKKYQQQPSSSRVGQSGSLSQASFSSPQPITPKSSHVKELRKEKELEKRKEKKKEQEKLNGRKKRKNKQCEKKKDSSKERKIDKKKFSGKLKDRDNNNKKKKDTIVQLNSGNLRNHQKKLKRNIEIRLKDLIKG